MQETETSAAVAHYRRLGYVVLSTVVPEEILVAVETVLDSHERSRNQALRRLEGGRSWISHADEITFTARLAGREPELRRILCLPALTRFGSEVIGPRVRLYFDQAVYKQSECQRIVPWHQDNGYNPKIPANYMTFWIPLTDTTVENGTIRFQPGRHHEGPLDHWRTSDGYIVCEEGASGGVTIDLHRGDVVAFSSLLPHATGPNSTQQIRKAYIASVAIDGTRLVDGSPCDDPATQPLLLAVN